MASVLITGSADGLGRMVAQRLVALGHDVVLHARNTDRARHAMAAVPGAREALTADLASIADDGLEHVFAINVLAPCLLRVPTKMGGPGAPDDLEQGAETQVWLAVSDDPQALVSGRYFYHKRPKPTYSAASDIALQDGLLDACEQLSGVRRPGRPELTEPGRCWIRGPTAWWQLSHDIGKRLAYVLKLNWHCPMTRLSSALHIALLACSMLLVQSAQLEAQGQPDSTSRQWVIPPLLPPGAQLAVVAGDPTKPGQSTIEVSMPDGYRLPPHLHPSYEHVEVKQGTLLVGMGDQLDAGKTQPLNVGDTATAPAGMHHYSVAKGPTIVAVTFMGPYTITYLHGYEAPKQLHSFPFTY